MSDLAIIKFSNDYAFLSNYYPSPIHYLGYNFPTVEHMYQAMKFQDPQIIRLFELYPSPEDAKYAGRHIEGVRSDWDAVKISVMKSALTLKFTQNSELKTKLLATNKVPLIEENNHNDQFWGVCNGSGCNHLGRLLMEIRDKLYEESN